MPNKVIVMSYHKKVAFATRLRQREDVLYAKGDGDRISFTIKGKPLGRIAGKGMAEKVIKPIPDDTRETFVLEILDDGDTVQLTTPAEDQRTCIYLEAVGGRLHLVGGASLVASIEGKGLRRIVEKDEEE